MRTLILIDTHILIWFVENNPKLSQMQLEQIVAPDNQIAVSIVTLWEIVIKQSLGKLPDFSASMEDLLAELDKTILLCSHFNPLILPAFVNCRCFRSTRIRLIASS